MLSRRRAANFVPPYATLAKRAKVKRESLPSPTNERLCRALRSSGSAITAQTSASKHNETISEIYHLSLITITSQLSLITCSWSYSSSG